MFQFEENEIGYTLTEYTAKDDVAVTSVKIPSVYQGEPVTCIGDYDHEDYRGPSLSM